MSHQVVSARPMEARSPWRWLRARVERLRMPIDFGPVGCGDERPPHPAVVELPGARSPAATPDGSAATDHARSASTPREGAVLRLRNGRSVRVRPAGPADAEAIQDFVRRLSDASRRLRFCAPVRELTPAMLKRLTEYADRRGLVLLAEVHDGRTWCIVALAEHAAGDDDGTCELALVVADAWQRVGLGHGLMGLLIQKAREARWVRIVADVLRENEAMLALGRAHDFALARSPHGSTMLRIERELRRLLPIDGARVSAGDVARAGLTAAFAAS
jgi:GNAT superfamily N-acetyltransferase